MMGTAPAPPAPRFGSARVGAGGGRGGASAVVVPYPSVVGVLVKRGWGGRKDAAGLQPFLQERGQPRVSGDTGDKRGAMAPAELCPRGVVLQKPPPQGAQPPTPQNSRAAPKKCTGKGGTCAWPCGTPLSAVAAPPPRPRGPSCGQSRAVSGGTAAMGGGAPGGGTAKGWDPHRFFSSSFCRASHFSPRARSIRRCSSASSSRRHSSFASSVPCASSSAGRKGHPKT